MNIDTIAQSLFALFTPENSIVFWDDAEAEFADCLDSLPCAEHGVTLVRRESISDLELKIKLELEPLNGEKFLLYAERPVPPKEEDWLLNIRLYAKSFSADSASIWLRKLGLTTIALRGHLHLRKKFFASQKRLDDAKRFLRPDDGEDALDMAILAVLTRSKHASLTEILIHLFMDQYPADTGNMLNFVTPLWTEVEKYGLAPVLWQRVHEEFGYTGIKEEDGTSLPTLKHLLRCLLVTDMGLHLGEALPAALRHFQLDSTRGTASGFRDAWIQNRTLHQEYARISGIIAQELGIANLLHQCHAEDFHDCATFEACERFIIEDVTRRAISDTEKPAMLKVLTVGRREHYWADWQDADGMRLYAVVYDGLDALLEIQSLKEKYPQGFSYASSAEAYTAYTTELFKFDQKYRHFCTAADSIELKIDILKQARTAVEAWIGGWYATQLTLCWDRLLGGDSGLLKTWRIQDIPPQQDFYQRFVSPLLNSAGKPRIYIILSDGLRYEVAEELGRNINREARLRAELKSQLGVLPGITALGMAALLPHTSLAFKEGTTDILVDGLPAATLEQRDDLLRRYAGRAIKADDLIAMNREDARAYIGDARVIYIYHNQIDSAGDNGSSEKQTFAAADQAVGRLTQIVRFIIDRLNGSHVFITADHGFIYQDAPVSDESKTVSPNKPAGLLKAKKRYMLGNNFEDGTGFWHGKTSLTAGVSPEADMDFWIPKGVGRFHLAGGARYTHGGAMPQEFVVPVLQIRELSRKALQKDNVKHVEVCMLDNINRIVNNIQKFIFIQTEKVDERMLPRTLSIFLSDGKQAVSDTKTITFDSSSESFEERKKTITLIMKNYEFDRTVKYYLILRDNETQAEYLRYPMTVDLSFKSFF